MLLHSYKNFLPFKVLQLLPSAKRHMEVPLLTENSFPTFEDFQHQNGMIYRWASEFLMMLGYMDIKEQKKLIEKTMKALINL
jgi:hypothetical protein